MALKDAHVFAPLREVYGEAFRAFERWAAEHDPDGNMDADVAARAYSEWASKNSIERYLDAAQPVAPMRETKS